MRAPGAEAKQSGRLRTQGGTVTFLDLMNSAKILLDRSAHVTTLNHRYRWTFGGGQIYVRTHARARIGIALHRHRFNVSRRGAGCD